MANTLYDALFGKHAGQETPFLFLPDGQTLTHRTFLEQAAQIAHVLTSVGLAPGDRVAAQIQKSPEALALYAACVQAGVVFLPLNTAYTERHGFPFIIAVRDHDKAGILAAFEARIANDTETEFETACAQVERIAELRLKELLP